MHKLSVVGILLLAFIVRSYGITEMPPPLFDDEANTALDALMYNDGAFSSLIGTGWGQVPVFFTAMNSVALKFFGPTVLGARATGVLLGTLTVLVMYFVARSMMNPRLALLVMLALALQRWHITMSRHGASQIALPFFVSLAFLFTVRGFGLAFGVEPIFNFFKNSRMSSKNAWYSWPIWSICIGGALLGLCMYIYLASRLVAVAAALFLVYVVIHGVGICIRERRFRFVLLLRRLGFILLYGVCYCLAFYPMANYYYQNPSVFTARWQQISLPYFMGIGTGTINWKPFVENITSYPLMLNYASNEVSRYGPPFQPVLNVISGTLFALGMVVLLRHLLRPVSIFCLLWLVLPLFGGFITVSETPSPFRTIVAALAVTIIMILPLHFFISRLSVGESKGKKLPRFLYWLMVVALVSSGIWDLYRYWIVQRNEPGLYRYCNYPEYAVAKRVQEIAPKDLVYLFPHYYTFSSVRMLNWKMENIRNFLSSEHVPVLNPKDSDVYCIVPAFMENLLASLQLFHPHATGRAVKPEKTPEFGYFEILIPARDFKEARGWWLNGADGTKSRVQTLERPVTLESGPQDVVWDALLDVPELGSYRFNLSSTSPLLGRGSLIVAGQQLTGPEHEIHLLAGRTSIQLRLGGMLVDEHVSISWKRPGLDWETIPLQRLYAFPSFGEHGLLGTYYQSMDLSGPIVAQRVDLMLSPNDSIESPHSTRWVGALDAPMDGDYYFDLKVDDGARLFLDGALKIDLWRLEGSAGGVSVPLSRGKHSIQLDYFDQGGGRNLVLAWTPPGAQSTPIAMEFFSHTPIPPQWIPFDSH